MLIWSSCDTEIFFILGEPNFLCGCDVHALVRSTLNRTKKLLWVPSKCLSYCLWELTQIFLLFLHMLDSRENVYKKVWFRKFRCNEHRSSNQKNVNKKNHGIQRIKTMEFQEKKLIAHEVHVSEISKFTCTTYRRKMIKWKKGPPNPFHRKAKNA